MLGALLDASESVRPWEREAKAETPGIDYFASFVAPVCVRISEP